MTYSVEVRHLSEMDTAEIHTRVPLANIGETMGSIFREVYEYLNRIGVVTPGQAFGCYVMHEQEQEVEIAAGFTTVHAVPGEGRIQPGRLPGGDAAVCLHVGPYDGIAKAYETIAVWLQSHGRRQAGPPWEVYLSPPEEVPPRTEVFFPLEGNRPS